MNKRCSNCYTFPFCNDIVDPKGNCDKWIKRERNLKLENTDGYNFDFEDID